MGGRGAKSSVNRSNSSSGAGSLGSLSESELKSKISSYAEKEKKAGEEMEKLAKYATPGKYSNTKEYKDKAEQYYKVQSQFNTYRKEKNRLMDKLAEEERKKEPKKESKKTFVNGYGEATKRNITTSTYKRNEKRAEKAILRNLGL